MGLIHDEKTYGLTIRESADDGSDFSNPDADYRRLFLGEDGTLKTKDSSGTVAPVGGGSGGDITTDDAWAAKGDLIAATGDDAAAVVTVGANGSSLRANSGAASGIEWQKNNLAASTAPAVTDDVDEGYTVGSRWIDTTADKEYVCLDNSDGAAVWTETTASGGSDPAFTTWTPALTSTGTNPTLGSGATATGRYVRIGDKVTASGVIVFGSGMSAGTGNYRVSLPVTARATLAANEVAGYGHIRDDNAGTSKGVLLRFVSTTTVGLMTLDAGATVQAGAPWAWAAGDEIDYVLEYEADD